MRWMLLSTVFLIGLLSPVQAGINAALTQFVGHPLRAGAVNMWTGALLMVLVVLAVGVGPPSIASLRAAPWWTLLGGLIGAATVLTMLVAAPRLGAVLLVGAFIAGQLVSSAAIDRFGLLHYPLREVNWSRWVGVGLVIVGVLLVERGSR
jgi:transporter family-2 protein